MQLREILFLKTVIPIVEELSLEWFDPQEKTIDGYNYSCTHCDCNCGRNDKHDDTCLYQRARDCVKLLANLDSQSDEYRLDIMGHPRKKEDILKILEYKKVDIVMNTIFPYVREFIPLDYNDPSNSNTVCSCSIFGDYKKHAKTCPYPKLSQAISDLLNPKATVKK